MLRFLANLFKIVFMLDTFNQPANFYLIKVNNKNSKKRSKICSKLTLKMGKPCHWHRSTVFTVERFSRSASIAEFNPTLHILYLKKQTDCGLFAHCKLKETKPFCFHGRFNRESGVCCKNRDILHENRQNIQFWKQAEARRSRCQIMYNFLSKYHDINRRYIYNFFSAIF